MSDWNFDVDACPDGHFETVTYKVKGDLRTKQKFVPFKVLTASSGDQVFVSYKLKDGRFNGYTEEVPPVAWQHLPVHPLSNKE